MAEWKEEFVKCVSSRILEGFFHPRRRQIDSPHPDTLANLCLGFLPLLTPRLPFSAES